MAYDITIALLGILATAGTLLAAYEISHGNVRYVGLPRSTEGKSEENQPKAPGRDVAPSLLPEMQYRANVQVVFQRLGTFRFVETLGATEQQELSDHPLSPMYMFPMATSEPSVPLFINAAGLTPGS